MFQSLKPMGSLKLTIQKFYRINGGSTQYKGVVPDILIPDAYSNLEVGEKTLEYAMPWDTVEALSYTRWAKGKPDVAELRKRSAARLKGDPYYRELTALVDKLQGKRDRSWLSLNKTKFFEEQEAARKDTERFEALQKESAALAVTALKPKEATATVDSLEVDKGKRWQEQLGRDFYLREAVQVITDMAAR
jgi:carboxyl-terminal processing protease